MNTLVLTCKQIHSMPMLIEIQPLENSEFCTHKTDPLDEGTLCKEEDESDWQGDYKQCSRQVSPLHIICAVEQDQPGSGVEHERQEKVEPYDIFWQPPI